MGLPHRLQAFEKGLAGQGEARVIRLPVGLKAGLAAPADGQEIPGIHGRKAGVGVQPPSAAGGPEAGQGPHPFIVLLPAGSVPKLPALHQGVAGLVALRQILQILPAVPGILRGLKEEQEHITAVPVGDHRDPVVVHGQQLRHGKWLGGRVVRDQHRAAGDWKMRRVAGDIEQGRRGQIQVLQKQRPPLFQGGDCIFHDFLQVRPPDRLQDVVLHPQADGLLGVFEIVEPGQDVEIGLTGRLTSPAHRLQTVHAGHADIHQGQVEVGAADGLHQPEAVAGFHHVVGPDAQVRQKHADGPADQKFVVGNQNFHDIVSSIAST